VQPYAAVEAAARKHAVAVTLAGVQGADGIEAAMTTLAREPGGGLIAPPDGFLVNHRQLIIELAARYRLPAIYGLASFAVQGGLASYGVKPSEQDRHAAAYVDRILRGEKPGDLPVADPIRFDNQFEDRKGARPGHLADAASPRRGSDRIRRRVRALWLH